LSPSFSLRVGVSGISELESHSLTVL
jgi:hypothetical protein